MNPAIIILARMKKIIRKFHAHNAITLENAQTKEELGIKTYLIFQKLIANKIVIPVGNNKFYLDVETETKHFQRIRQRMFFVLLAVIIILIVLAITNNL